MRKFLLSEVTEMFLYLTTGIGMVLTIVLGASEAPESIVTPIGIIVLLLFVTSLYYGAWRGIQRNRGL